MSDIETNTISDPPPAFISGKKRVELPKVADVPRYDHSSDENTKVSERMTRELERSLSSVANNVAQSAVQEIARHKKRLTYDLAVEDARFVATEMLKLDQFKDQKIDELTTLMTAVLQRAADEVLKAAEAKKAADQGR